MTIEYATFKNTFFTGGPGLGDTPNSTTDISYGFPITYSAQGYYVFTKPISILADFTSYYYQFSGYNPRFTGGYPNNVDLYETTTLVGVSTTKPSTYATIDLLITPTGDTLYYPDEFFIDYNVTTLFTNSDDAVNFNFLAPAQTLAVSQGADLYNTLAGNDTITLPSSASAQSLGSSGKSYDVTKYLNLGSGTDVVNVSADNSRIALGTGSDTINLGSAINTILALGTGTATIHFGALSSQTVMLGPPPPLFVPNVTISGFTIGDTVDLTNQPYPPSPSEQGLLANVDPSTGILTIDAVTFGSSPVAVEKFTLTNYTLNESFALSSDNAGGTDITIGVPTPDLSTLANLENATYDQPADYQGPGATSGDYIIMDGTSDSAGLLADAFVLL
jgi:hypothetical protein